MRQFYVVVVLMVLLVVASCGSTVEVQRENVEQVDEEAVTETVIVIEEPTNEEPLIAHTEEERPKKEKDKKDDDQINDDEVIVSNEYAPIVMNVIDEEAELIADSLEDRFSMIKITKYPVGHYCAEDYDWSTFMGGCSWYCGINVPTVSASSTLSSPNNSYDPIRAYDFNPLTAWSEGVDGYGVGETYTMRFNDKEADVTMTHLVIINGYIKSKETWEENGRVKKIGIYVDGAFIREAELEDVMMVQRVPIGEIPINSGFSKEVTIEILDVYPGSEYEDTCISEMFIDGTGVH